jgi:hypothetical protein
MFAVDDVDVAAEQYKVDGSRQSLMLPVHVSSLLKENITQLISKRSKKRNSCDERRDYKKTTVAVMSSMRPLATASQTCSQSRVMMRNSKLIKPG